MMQSFTKIHMLTDYIIVTKQRIFAFKAFKCVFMINSCIITIIVQLF